MNLILLLLLFSLILVASESLKKFFYLSSEVTRRLSHALGAILATFLPILTDLRTTVILGLIFTVVMFVSKRSKLLSSIHGVKRESVGAILFPLGITISALFFWETPKIFRITCLVMGLSDSLAGLFGTAYGRRRYNLTGLKTIEGSLVFTATTLLILLISGYNSDGSSVRLFRVIIISLILTFTEGISGGGWDNLTVPIVTGLLLRIIV